MNIIGVASSIIFLTVTIHQKFTRVPLKKRQKYTYQTRNLYPKIDTISFDTILNNIITGIHYSNLMILCTEIKKKLFYKLGSAYTVYDFFLIL